MKALPSIAFNEFKGSAGDVTARVSKGRQVLSARSMHSSSKTPAQAVSRNRLAKISRSYKKLSDEQIFEGLRLKAYLCPGGVWTIGYGHTASVKPGMVITEAQAEELLKEDLAVFEKSINEQNLDLTQNMFDALVSFTFNVGIDNFRRSTLLASFTFQLTGMPESSENLKLIIMASAPQSNGISRAYSKAVQIGEPRDIVDTVIDLKTDYEAVHGAVTEAAPKVFLKYFFVNTVSGEKSGEMLGTIKLA